MDIAFRLKIRFIGEKDVRIGGMGLLSSPKGQYLPRGKSPISDLTSTEIETLRKLEPRVLRWISLNKKNAVLFSLDPVSALTKVGLKFNGALLKKLQQMREKNRVMDRPMAGARLERVIIETISPKQSKGKKGSCR